jgi:hypothetical protein
MHNIYIMTKSMDQASQIRQRLNQIPVEMAAEVRRMVSVRTMVRGYLYHSRRRCGKPTCHCARGELHEAWVLATKVNGKATTRSVATGLRRKVEKLAGNYRQFRDAQGAMRKLCKEAARLGRELEGLVCEDLFKEAGQR